MNGRLFCYGRYDEMCPGCIVRCPDMYSCIEEKKSKKARALLETAMKELREDDHAETKLLHREV